MKYLIFDSEPKAKTRSANLFGEKIGATTYLLGWTVHPSTGKAALNVPPGYETRLTKTEQGKLTDLDSTWFPKPPTV